MSRRYLCGAVVGVLATAGALTTAFGASAARPASSHAQPKLSVMRPLGFKGLHHSKPARPTHSNNLTYHGGAVETAPKLYLVLWGSQWNSNDPSGEESLLASFFGKAGGSSWLASVTQYCQGVANGTVYCNGAGTPAGGGVSFSSSTSVWYDSGSAAPSSPSQSQLAAEAIRAAAHFGNTASGSNNTTQYVVATATHNSASGFGTQYCAWHSSTSSSYGTIAYTNLPYITDAGSSCGANFNNLGSKAGITIVEGHEMAETITDQYPNGGWLDQQGAENGDKCAWITTGNTGASASVSLNGTNFPVQSLWSNATSNCAISYP